MNKPASTKKGKGAWINCGIDKEVRVDLPAPAGTRVTGKFQGLENILPFGPN